MELSKAKVVPGFVIGRILFLDGGRSNNLAPMKKVTEYDAPISDKGSYPDISKGEQYHVCIEENRIRFAV